MPYITLETYPPMRNEDGSENRGYDYEMRIFTVPFQWLYEEFNRDNFGTASLEDLLLNEYTWDDTFFLYERATTDEVIVHEQIVNR